MNSTELFSGTSPMKLFFIASIPGAISMFASALYYTIEGIFVGHFLGSTAFAALNLAMPFVIINFSLADLIGVGSSVPISIHLGRGERDTANNIFTCACIMILVTGALIGAVLYWAAPFLMGLMGAQGEFAHLAVQYLRVYALCSPLTTILFAVDNYLRICGYIRGSLFINIFMSVLCVILEFTFLGILRFGIWGSALATCGGMAISSVAAFIPFFRGKALLRFCRPVFHMGMIRQIIACGSPTFLNNIAGRITSILLNTLLVRLGGEIAVSVYGILMFADGLIQPLLYGVCDSLQPAVGYNYGAGIYPRVRQGFWFCVKIGVVFLTVCSVIGYIYAPEIVEWFRKGDPEVTAVGTQALRWQLITLPLGTWVILCNMLLQTIRRPVRAVLLASARQGLFFIPAILILPCFLGLQGVEMSQAVADLCSFLFALPVAIPVLNSLKAPRESTN